MSRRRREAHRIPGQTHQELPETMKRNELRTVLYVDDEPDIREVVEMSLALVDGLQVHTCDSGARALQEVQQLRPDLVLLDVMMPGMDGPATLVQLRQLPHSAHIPVVFMTAKAMPQELQRLIQLGAAGMIAKPFDPMRLGEQLLAIWDKLEP